MTDTLKKLGKETTLVIYNPPRAPKYIKLNKKIITFMIIFIPSLFMVSITSSFLYSLSLKEKLADARSKEPEAIKILNEKISILSEQKESAEKSILEITKKLSQPTNSSPLSSLDLFSSPQGIQDLTDKALIRTENFEVKTSHNNELVLSFNLNNNKPEQGKIRGFINIIQIQEGLIQYYPQYKISEVTNQLNFSKGESFTASRFRPVKANFSKLTNKSSTYKIYIFSRTGDLIHYQQVGPFNNE